MPSPESPRMVRAMQSGDRDAVASLLADPVTFHSPVATYADRDDVVHLLLIIGDVVEELTVTSAFDGDDRTVTLLSGRVGDHPVDGALVEVADADGLLTELTLMLRPLDGLLAGVQQMGQRLAANPLPSVS